MSVEQTNKVDFIGIDGENSVVLTVSDHLEWDAARKHLLALQGKLNRYLSFIESGELLREYPGAKNRKIVIQVVGKYTPDEEGRLFLDNVERAMEAAGYSFRFTTAGESDRCQ